MAQIATTGSLPVYVGCCRRTDRIYGRNARGKRLREDHGEEIRSRYIAGETAQAIADSLGHAQPLVSRIIREAGLTRSLSQIKRVHSLNEHCFDIIDSEWAAYFLGFMYADGNNNQKKGLIHITQAEGAGEDVLENFLKFTGSSSGIRYYDNVNPRACRSARVTLCSKHLCSALALHGMVPNKTFKLVFPAITPGLRRHFIRGYLDGDGCVQVTKGGNMCAVSFVGTEAMCRGMEEVFDDICGEPSCHIRTRHPERNNNIRSLALRRRKNAEDVLRWMYDGATISMKRKREKVELFLKTRGAWPS